MVVSPPLADRAAHQHPQPNAARGRTSTALCYSDAVVEWTTGSGFDQRSPGRAMQTAVLPLSLAASAREKPTDVCDRRKARNLGH